MGILSFGQSEIRQAHFAIPAELVGAVVDELSRHGLAALFGLAAAGARSVITRRPGIAGTTP